MLERDPTFLQTKKTKKNTMRGNIAQHIWNEDDLPQPHIPCSFVYAQGQSPGRAPCAPPASAQHLLGEGNPFIHRLGSKGWLPNLFMFLNKCSLG